MANFSYTALDKTNSYVKGKIAARNLKKASAQLEQEGFLVVNIKKEKLPAGWLAKLNNISTISRVDRIFFTRHLYTLLESGIALDQATKIAAEQATNQRFKAILNDIHSQIIKGQTLHAALAPHSKYFSNFFINLVRVGEKSGTLDESLLHLLEQQEKDYELLTKTRGAMIYPGIIIFAALLVVILMMTFVVPTISGLLLEYGVDLPWTTKVLIFLSNFLLHYGWLVAIFLVGLIVLLGRLMKLPKGRWYWEEFLFKLPVLDQIIVEFNLARFSRSMSALLQSGVAIDEALESSANISRNSHYQRSIDGSIKFVRKGVPLTEVLHASPKLFPAITTRMLEIGEKTGKLDLMFTRLAIFYEKSVLNTLNNLSSIIEPVLILMIGLSVGFIAVSILSPIWKFAQTF